MHVHYLIVLLASMRVIAQTCQPQLKSPKPAGLRCGSLQQPIRTSSIIRPSITTDSLASCAASCAIGECMTFTYNGETCARYRRSGQKMGLKTRQDGATRFYNRACFESPEPFTAREFSIKIASDAENTVGIRVNGNVFYSAFSSDPNENVILTNVQYGGRQKDLAQFSLDAGQLVQEVELLDRHLKAFVSIQDGSRRVHPKETGLATDFPLNCVIDQCTRAFTCSTSLTDNTFFACDDGQLHLLPDDTFPPNCIRITASVFEYDMY